MWQLCTFFGTCTIGSYLFISNCTIYHILAQFEPLCFFTSSVSSIISYNIQYIKKSDLLTLNKIFSHNLLLSILSFFLSLQKTHFHSVLKIFSFYSSVEHRSFHYPNFPSLRRAFRPRTGKTFTAIPQTTFHFPLSVTACSDVNTQCNANVCRSCNLTAAMGLKLIQKRTILCTYLFLFLLIQWKNTMKVNWGPKHWTPIDIHLTDIFQNMQFF